MDDRNYNERGNVLIYALLTIAAILSSTIVVSNIVGSRIKQAGLIGNSQTAYLSAESCLEKTIYSLRKSDQPLNNGDCGLSEAQADLKIETDAVKEMVLDLPDQKFIQFDLFNANNLALGGGVESLDLTWDGGNTWIEASVVEGKVENNEIIFPEFIAENVKKMNYGNNQATANSFSMDKVYRVRLKAAHGALENLKVKIYSQDNTAGDSLPFSNILRLTAVGADHDTTQTVAVDLFKDKPEAGLDYVNFSE